MPLTDAQRNEMLSFVDTVEAKIQDIVQEFAEGQLNREQFHILYERYHDQLASVNDALAKGDIDMFYGLRNGMATVAIRDAFQAKATGLIIHFHKGDTILETLGKFNLGLVGQIAPKLSEIGKTVSSGQFVDWYLEKFDEDRWVLFEPGRYTTVVTLFQNEPSQKQCEAIDQMHRDFEKANLPSFQSQHKIDSSKLAYPFMVFVRAL